MNNLEILRSAVRLRLAGTVQVLKGSSEWKLEKNLHSTPKVVSIDTVA